MPCGLAGAVASLFLLDAAGELPCVLVVGVVSPCVSVAARQLPDGVRASPWGEGEGLLCVSAAALHGESAPALASASAWLWRSAAACEPACVSPWGEALPCASASVLQSVLR